MEKTVKQIIIIILGLVLTFPAINARTAPDTTIVFVRGMVVDESNNPLPNCEIIVAGLGYEVNSLSDSDGVFLFQIGITPDFLNFNIALIFKFRRQDNDGKSFSRDIQVSPRKIKDGTLNLPRIVVPINDMPERNTNYTIWDLLTNQMVETEEKSDSLWLSSINLKEELKFFTEENRELTSEVLHYLDENEELSKINFKLKRTILKLEQDFAAQEILLNRVVPADSLPQLNFTYHKVAKGESLSLIASQMPIFETPAAWKLLYFLNYDLIADPDLIYPSQRLRLPVLDR